MHNPQELPDNLVSLEERRRNVPDLKLVTTNGGTIPPTGNWLLDKTEVGTQFFVADKIERQNFILLRLEVMKKDVDCVSLWAYPTEAENMDGRPFGVVHPGRFVNRFELIKIISMPSTEEAVNPQE